MNQKLTALILATVVVGAMGTPAITIGRAATGNTGTLTGSVANSGGAAVGNAPVAIYNDANDVYRTNADNAGDYTLNPVEGTYTMIVSPPKNRPQYAPNVTRGITVTAGETTERSVTLHEPVTFSGTVVDGETGVSNVGVLLDDGNRFYGAFTGDTGSFSTTIPPGEYNVMIYSQQGYILEGGLSLDTSTDDTTERTLNVVKPTVESSTVSVVQGAEEVDESSLSVDASVRNGFMMVRLLKDQGTPTPGPTTQSNPGMPADLTSLGVDRDTVFEIEMTLRDYDPNSLLWGARDVSWSTSQNDDGTVDVTVQTKAVHLAGITGHGLKVGPLMGTNPDKITWPTGSKDRADLGWKHTVYFGLYDLSNVPSETREQLDGMTVTTNAQTFMLPRVNDDSMEIWVGGPHKDKSGNDHDGFYEAKIPDSQLSDWGVSTTDPASELQASYKGSDQSPTITDVADGVKVEMPISYSSGSVSVSPSDGSPTNDPSSGGSGGGGAAGRHLSGSDSITERLYDSPVSEARVDFGRSIEGRVSIRSIRALPSDVPRPDSPILSSVDITVPENERDRPGTVSLTLSRRSITQADVTTESLKIARLERGADSPEILETSVNEVTDDSVEVTAETPGFSVFVVVSTETADTPTATPVSAKSTPTPPQSTPTTTPEPTMAPDTATPAPESTTAPAAATPQPRTPSTPTPASGPGFGLLGTLVGLLSAIVLARRH
jgi:PGF-CTERM protein